MGVVENYQQWLSERRQRIDEAVRPTFGLAVYERREQVGQLGGPDRASDRGYEHARISVRRPERHPGTRNAEGGLELRGEHRLPVAGSTFDEAERSIDQLDHQSLSSDM